MCQKKDKRYQYTRYRFSPDRLRGYSSDSYFNLFVYLHTMYKTKVNMDKEILKAIIYKIKNRI